MIFWVTERRWVTGPVLEDNLISWRLRFQAPKLPVRENDAGQIFVANLLSLPVSTEQEFQSIYS